MKTLIVAPHPDDELLGVGGTLLRRVSEGCTVGWLLMTAITEERGWSTQRIDRRAREIELVRQGLQIAPHNFYELNFPTAELDKFPMSVLVGEISKVFESFEPEEVLLPHPGDIHSDHRVAFDSACACTKWFRYPSVKRVLTYETLSETDFSLDKNYFTPNLLIDITDYLEKKLQLLSIYKSELGEHPFPRSLKSVEAQAILRGVQRGTKAAEAFQILRQFE
tara:strand:+ start:404 stop:1069 length:666 start_codon:yes stop_codon:yes gene_type:complete